MVWYQKSHTNSILAYLSWFWHLGWYPILLTREKRQKWNEQRNALFILSVHRKVITSSDYYESIYLLFCIFLFKYCFNCGCRPFRALQKEVRSSNTKLQFTSWINPDIIYFIPKWNAWNDDETHYMVHKFV